MILPICPLTGGVWLAIDIESHRPLLGRAGCFGALASYHDAFGVKRMQVELWIADLGVWLSHNAKHDHHGAVAAAQSQLCVLSGLTTSKLPKTRITVVEDVEDAA